MADIKKLSPEQQKLELATQIAEENNRLHIKNRIPYGIRFILLFAHYHESHICSW